jgi:hypothetical protein
VNTALSRLNDPQRAAWSHVEAVVARRGQDARARLVRVLESTGCGSSMLDAATEAVRQHARVVVHFHPDRIGITPVSVAEALLESGEYRSQFETGLSSGSLTAFPGGPRDAWERTLFGGAYHRHGSVPGDRPKYGALELIRYPDGPWPRFGSCYLVLSAEVSRRTSFTFAGSEQADAVERLGTLGNLECVFAALLAEVACGEGVKVPWPPFVAPMLGVSDLSVRQLLVRLRDELPLPRRNAATGSAGRVLDSGIEAQVHGPIIMAHDVERLVMDPSFVGTRIGECLEELCRRHAIPLERHVGFRLAAREVPDDFRGPEVATLARTIAIDGMIDASVIGAAHRSVRLQPQQWRRLGSPRDFFDQLKKLWHALVHYGLPTQAGSRLPESV